MSICQRSSCPRSVSAPAVGDVFPKRLVWRARLREGARRREVGMRQPAAPVRRAAAPFRSKAAEVVRDIQRARAGNREGIIHRVRTRRRLDHDTAPVVAQPRAFHGHGHALLLLLHLHHEVAGPDRFEAIRRGDVAARFDLNARRDIAPRRRIERLVKGDYRLRLARRPREHGLRRGFVGVADFENAALAAAAHCPSPARPCGSRRRGRPSAKSRNRPRAVPSAR